jgi:hypothetical protein
MLMQKDPATNETTKDHEETSSKTLNEIEESEKTSDAGTGNPSTPSPDGAFDDADEREQAGPI